MRASNVGKVGKKNHDSRQVSGLIACCERFDRQVLHTQLCHHGKLATLIAGKRRRLLFKGDDDEVSEVYDKEPQRRQQNIV